MTLAVKGKVVVASRFFGSRDEDFARLERFVDRWDEIGGVVVLVAVDVTKDKTDASTKLCTRRGCVRVLQEPWGSGVTTVLSVILQAASQTYEADLLLMCSPEVVLDRNHFEKLVACMDRNTLVAGYALPGHQRFLKTCQVELSGWTSPWNTCCIWSVPFLMETGWPAYADQLDPAGMEEIGVVALHQAKHGVLARQAKLVACSDVKCSSPGWDVEFTGDQARLKRHERKMASKFERGRQLLELINCSINPLVRGVFLY